MVQSHEQKTQDRGGTRQEMSLTNLQHPGVHVEFNNAQAPRQHIFEAQDKIEPKLVTHSFVSDISCVQNQTCG